MAAATPKTGPNARIGSRHVSRERAERYLAREQAIVETAFKQINARESPAISLTEVLRATGLSNRAFYRQFESKDELVLHMCRTEYSKMTIRMAKALGRASSPIQAVEMWIDEALDVAYDERRARTAIILSLPDARSAEGYMSVTAEGLKAQRDLLTEAISAGKEAGDFPLAQPDDDARAIQAVVNNLVEARLHGEAGPSRDHARRHILGVFTRAFGA